MATSVNNFVIDHVIRGFMTDRAGNYLWSVNQITNPSLSVTTENSQAVDALGSVIAEFDRARNAQLSGENSLFDLGLYAAQMGQSKVEGAAGNTITTPALETITIASVSGDNYAVSGDTRTYITKHVPNSVIKQIYKLNGDGTLGKVYTASTSASNSAFVYEQSTHKITLPLGLSVGEELFVMYEYEAASGSAVIADAINFPKAGVFVMEVLGVDTCNPDTQIYAYVKFPNAKLDTNVDYSFQTDGTHPFTIKALQDYCDSKKKLFEIIIPHEETDEDGE